MRARLHPDARLDPVRSDFIGPNWDGVVEPEATDTNVPCRRDSAALPAVGEHRVGSLGRDHGRNRLGEDEPAPERRADRRDEPAMVAPGQAAGDGTARIAAAAVGNPPFTPLGLAKIAAYRARESDRRWSSSLVHLPLSRAERKDQHQAKPGDESEGLILLVHDSLRTFFRRCRYSSTSRTAWPLGSRIISAFLKPSLPCASCGMATTLELMNCAPAWRNRPASAWILLLTSVTCQFQRSLALLSAGISRPPGGVLYSRNSTCGGAEGGIIAVTRQVSLRSPSSTSCVVPLFNVVTPTLNPSRSR